MYSLGEEIYFFFSFVLFSNSTMLSFGSKHKVKEKAQMFARRQISTASRPIDLNKVFTTQNTYRVEKSPFEKSSTIYFCLIPITRRAKSEYALPHSFIN